MNSTESRLSLSEIPDGDMCPDPYSVDSTSVIAHLFGTVEFLNLVQVSR